jgi:hypothetical protein
MTRKQFSGMAVTMNNKMLKEKRTSILITDIIDYVNKSFRKNHDFPKTFNFC